jgi:DNA polymerase
LLIGEAPGANEDAQGKPFVGEAGKLLDKILSAIKLSRSDVFVTNVVKCRPPNNRDPLPEEIGACASILEQQLEILKPKFILILGRIAAQSLLKTAKALRELRGQVVELFNAQVVVTYHPSALLREPALKRSAWEDVQLFQKLCERTES